MNGVHTEPLLVFIILAPLVGAAILGLFGKRLSERVIGIIACSTVAISAVLSFVVFFKHRADLQAGAKVFDYLFKWIEVGNFRADFALMLGEFYCASLNAPILVEIEREGVVYARVYDIRERTVSSIFTLPPP